MKIKTLKDGLIATKLLFIICAIIFASSFFFADFGKGFLQGASFCIYFCFFIIATLGKYKANQVANQIDKKSELLKKYFLN